MRRISKVKRVNSRNLDKYVNVETGETLLSELISERGNIKYTKESDLITIESKEFIVIDSIAMKYIKTLLTSKEYDRVMEMGNMLKTEFNVVFNYNIPHNPNTLSDELKLSLDDLKRLVNKLVRKGILSYIVCAPSGFIQKIYMLNPTVIRKRKTFHKDMLTFFEDFNKK